MELNDLRAFRNHRIKFRGSRCRDNIFGKIIGITVLLRTAFNFSYRIIENVLGVIVGIKVRRDIMIDAASWGKEERRYQQKKKACEDNAGDFFGIHEVVSLFTRFVHKNSLKYGKIP